ncbi:MAG: bactofilin family protein [Hyphomicrobiaceae bacterium]
MLSNFGGKKSEQDNQPVRGHSHAPALGGHTSQNAPSLSVRSAATGPAARPIDRASPSVIGPGLTIMGNLISNGEVQVDGEIQGDLHGTHIVVGEKARITGGVNAEEIVVRGHVMGSIRGRKVMLQASSHVEGDVHHQSLAIEQGAYFEGKSRRSEDALAGIERPDTPVDAS